MTIVLGVRHGEVLNPDGVIYAGLPGYGLSDRGREEAENVARDLAGTKIAALYSSPLDRAMETATVIADVVGAEILPDERLHEWRHWQQWAGKTWAALAEEAAESWAAYQRDPGAVTSGESLAELGDRMQDWLDEACTQHTDGVVVAVSHLEPLRTILLRLQGRPARDLFDVTIPTGHVVRILPDPDPEPKPASELVR